MCEPVSEPNEAAVCAAMVEGAREALAGYCSSIDEDLGLIRGGSLVPGSREELAVQVRGGAALAGWGGGGGGPETGRREWLIKKGRGQTWEQGGVGSAGEGGGDGGGGGWGNGKRGRREEDEGGRG